MDKLDILQKVNLEQAVLQEKELYVYRKVGLLNDHVLSIVNVENRILDFHVHEESDELFYVIEGTFQLETKTQKIQLDPGEFIIVPKGTLHRPVVTTLTRFLMIEMAGTLNKENSGALYEE